MKTRNNDEAINLLKRLVDALGPRSIGSFTQDDRKLVRQALQAAIPLLKRGEVGRAKTALASGFGIHEHKAAHEYPKSACYYLFEAPGAPRRWLKAETQRELIRLIEQDTGHSLKEATASKALKEFGGFKKRRRHVITAEYARRADKIGRKVRAGGRELTRHECFLVELMQRVESGDL